MPLGVGHQPGDEPVPGYRLDKFLGRGGFGEVWKAKGPGGTAVALKFITLGAGGGDKEYRALRLVKQIRQANLTPIFSFWLKDAGGDFIADEEFEEPPAAQPVTQTLMAPPPTAAPPGSSREAADLIIAMGLGDKSLADRLDECKVEGLPGIPPRELIGYMRDAAKAIDFLNSSRHGLGRGTVGIQHCDIKPLNMLIVGNAVQVCDFGLARVLNDVRATTPAFSLAYSAPEFIEKNAPGVHTDQYSLAISYVEMRTGQLPFGDNPTQASVWNAHLTGKLDLHLLPPAEQTVIRKATMKDPVARYATSGDMVEALHSAIEFQVAEQQRKRHRWIVRGMTTFAAIVVAFVGLRSTTEKNEPLPASSVPGLPPPALLTMAVAPPEASLSPGTTLPVVVNFTRSGVDGPIDLHALDVPSGLTVELDPGDPQSDQRTLHVRVKDAAAPGPVTIRLAAVAKDAEQEFKLRVTIESLWVPNGDFIAEAKFGTINSGGKTFAKRIIFRRDGLEIPFLFIDRTHNDDPTAFYIMEQKVTNGQFQRFAELHSDKVKNSQWEKGGVARGKDVGAANPDLPVLHVRCDEAWAFAAWVGGRLPSVDQWNKAAGVNEDASRVGPGPFRATPDGKPDGSIAVGRSELGPAPVGTSPADIGFFGCRDMAGNGWEWTRSTLDGNLSQPPDPKEAHAVLDVILRGHCYLAAKPPTFAELSNKQDFETFAYDQADPCIGFRVVFDNLLP